MLYRSLCLAVFLTVLNLVNPVLAEVIEPNNVFQNDVININAQLQHTQLPADSNSAIAINFQMAEDWHFYADAQTALTPELFLQVKPLDITGIEFDEPLMPPTKPYFDKAQNKQINVYSGSFAVYIPFTVRKHLWSNADIKQPVIRLQLIGGYCSDFQCRILQDVELSIAAPALSVEKSKVAFELPRYIPRETVKLNDGGQVQGSFGIITLTKLGLAFITGLLFNVMPCVLPVIPLIITKLINQSQQSRVRSIALGWTLCVGIIIFFAVIAVVNIVLRLGFDTVFQWGDYFRYGWFIKSMALLLIVLGLFMFGLFTIAVPSSVASKAGSGQGYSGAFGMGFLAALLSTPCSFGILAGVFAWAQTQSLLISTAVLLVMGAGMAAPYAVLISLPKLMNKLPKPGEWMERVKQAMGFILLIIAIKVLEALALPELISTLYFAIVLSVAVWMWGSWVNFNTKKGKKYIVRLIAVVIAVTGGFYLLTPQKQSVIDWQEYDAAVIEKAKQAGQPVLIKFDAKWCASCKVVEKTVYSDKQIAQMLKDKNVLTIKADTTEISMPATEDLKNIYNEPGIPVSIIWLPNENEPIKLRGLIGKRDLIDALESASR